MSLVATGLGVTRQRDGTITVRAEIAQEDGGQRRLVTVSGPTLADCRAQLQEQVDEQARNATVNVLAAAVVGQILARSGDDAGRR